MSEIRAAETESADKLLKKVDFTPEQLADRAEKVAKLQGLLEMQSLTNALQPFVRRIDFIERELQRSYTHLEQKLHNRGLPGDDMEWITKLRGDWRAAMTDYAEALLKVTNRL